MNNNFYKKTILLVEDDPNFGSILKDYLSLNDYQVSLARNGLEGFDKFIKNDYDLCILDVMMPYKDGFSLAKDIRTKNKEVPIIFLTAKSMKEDVLQGYKLGADDYLNKPFDSEVLLKKIEILFKRLGNKKPSKHFKHNHKLGRFRFNSKLRSLQFDKEEAITLSPKENNLLIMLIQHKNDLMPRELALNNIWKEDNYFTSRSMDVYIAKLRKILRKDPKIEIINIHGEGFRMVADS